MNWLLLYYQIDQSVKLGMGNIHKVATHHFYQGHLSMFQLICQMTESFHQLSAKLQKVLQCCFLEIRGKCTIRRISFDCLCYEIQQNIAWIFPLMLLNMMLQSACDIRDKRDG